MLKIILFIFALFMVFSVQAHAMEEADLVKLVKKHALKPDGSPAYPEFYKSGTQYADNKQLVFIDEVEEGERVQPTSKAEMLKLEKAEYDKRK